MEGMLPSKKNVVAVLSQTLSEELEAVERVAAMARDEVASEESRPENEYDTRATEASYLARGQAWRVMELRKLTAWFSSFDAGSRLDTVQLGALVALDGHRQDLLFIAPVGGPRAEIDGHTVRVISLESPLGQAMRGLEAGDGFEVEGPSAVLEYEILDLC